MSTPPKAGRIGWIDLTVPDAERIRDFYSSVVGWTTSSVSMGDYDDFCVHPAEGDDPVAGICHARGPNEGIPPQWLVYIDVADLDASIAACGERGGEVVSGPRDMGPYGRMAVIRDPAGAVCGIIEPAKTDA